MKTRGSLKAAEKFTAIDLCESLHYSEWEHGNRFRVGDDRFSIGYFKICDRYLYLDNYTSLTLQIWGIWTGEVRRKKMERVSPVMQNFRDVGVRSPQGLHAISLLMKSG